MSTIDNTSSEHLQTVELAVRYLRSCNVPKPDCLVIAGSGFKDAIKLDSRLDINMGEIPGYPRPKVHGHGGALSFGTCGSKSVMLAAGRVHLYEGHRPTQVAFPVFLANALGCKSVVLTNAAGSVDPGIHPGSFVLLKDQINLTGRHFAPADFGGRSDFTDMLNCYDPDWQKRVLDVAAIPTAVGVYAGVTGPAYETSAEAKMLALLGANVVGMSTVLECIAARSLGMKVLGLSLVTNFAGGLSGTVDHKDVLKVATSKTEAMSSLLFDIIQTSL
jgi:purine-nucleoside phosphorylase